MLSKVGFGCKPEIKEQMSETTLLGTQGLRHFKGGVYSSEFAASSKRLIGLSFTTGKKYKETCFLHNPRMDVFISWVQVYLQSSRNPFLLLKLKAQACQHQEITEAYGLYEMYCVGKEVEQRSTMKVRWGTTRLQMKWNGLP